MPRDGKTRAGKQGIVRWYVLYRFRPPVISRFFASDFDVAENTITFPLHSRLPSHTVYVLGISSVHFSWTYD